MEATRLFLSRRRLSKEQRTVLLELYQAHPAKVPLSKLRVAIGYTDRQMAGLMGAFGRRFTHTPGYLKGDHFFDWVWQDNNWLYGLPDSVRTAMVA